MQALLFAVLSSSTTDVASGHLPSGRLALPMTSLTDEFVVTKDNLHPTLHDLPDPVISNVTQRVSSGRKW